MRPKINSKNEVLTRDQTEDIKIRRWENTCSLIQAYRFVCDIKDGMKTVGKRIIYRIALTDEWLKEKEESGSGVKCINCKDTGANRARMFCSCSLGVIAKKCFKEI